MNKSHLVLMLLILFLLCAGCTRAITGKIVDAETGQPIEGAILLVEWTKVHGFGDTYTTSEKVVVLYSDKDGIVHIPDYYDPFADKPDITIYKPGYVAWNNQWIFPETRKRTDFKWKNNYVFRLDKFKDGYSYVKHESFVSLCINIGQQNANKKLLWNMYSQHEENKYLIELRNNKGGESKQ